MARKKCADYALKKSLPVTTEGVQHWFAEGPDGPADVYLGDARLRDRAASLPRWGPFTKVTVGDDEEGVYVIVPGTLSLSLIHI